MNVVFVGGDERMAISALLLEKEGHRVKTVGLKTALPTLSTDEIFSFAEAVVLPIPCTKDGKTVLGTDIPLSLFANPSLILWGGALPPFLRSLPLAHDFLEDEPFTLSNALLTAQGGIAYALGATKRGFWGIDAAVLGFGRIGGFLTEMMRGFAVPISVYARREEVLTRASLLGFQAKKWQEPLSVPERVVFNTIPQEINGLSFSPSSLVIDLGGGLAHYASHPVTSLRGLPGIFSPKAAGEIVYKTLSAFFRKE